MENKFFGNYFQLTGCFEGFDPEMVWSENFHFKPFPDSRTKRERAFDFDFDFADFVDHSLRLRLRRSTNPSIYESIMPSTSPIFDPEPSTYRSMNPRTDLWPRAFDFADDPEPSRHELIFDPSPLTQSHEPTNRSPSLCVILIDPRTHEPLISDFFFCCCGGVGGGVLVVFLLCGGGFCVGGGGK